MEVINVTFAQQEVDAFCKAAVLDI